MRSVVLSALLLLSITIAPPASAAEGIVELQPLPGDVSSGASLLSDTGVTAGSSEHRDGVYTPVRWSAAGAPTRLATLGDAVWLTAIHGDTVAGNATIPGDREWHAAVWDVAGGIRRLQEPPGALGSSVHGMNGTNVAVGSFTTAAHRSQPARWNVITGEITLLPMLPGTVYGNAELVNDRGEIVGWMKDLYGSKDYVRWNLAGTVELLDGMTGDCCRFGEPRAINEHGVVAGTAAKDDNVRWPALARRGALFAPLGDLPGGAIDINDSGVVIGSVKSGSDGRWVRWDAGRMTFLELLNGTGFITVQDINNAGVVVGYTSVGLAAKWDAEGKITVLPRRSPNDYAAYAQRINKPGHILGRIGSTAVVWR